MNSIEPDVFSDSVTREKGSERSRAFKFGVVLGAALGAIGLWMLFRSDSAFAAKTLLGIAPTIPLYALVHPAGALAFRAVWMRASGVLGRVNSVILLSLLYVLVVTPLGLLSRVLGRRPLARVRKKPYFIVREPPHDEKRFEHPY